MFKKGDIVTIRKDLDAEDDNILDEMIYYSGDKAQVKTVIRDREGEAVYLHIDVDDGVYGWFPQWFEEGFEIEENNDETEIYSKDITVERILLIYALRYALDRQNLAPVVVYEAIENNLDNLSKDFLQSIVEEIELYDGDISCEIYVNNWIRLREDIKKHIENK